MTIYRGWIPSSSTLLTTPPMSTTDDQQHVEKKEKGMPPHSLGEADRQRRAAEALWVRSIDMSLCLVSILNKTLVLLKDGYTC